jgi:molybdopterin-guanine dinucleotide biosynthesis protein A
MAEVPTRASITGVILAGGRGTRMGGADKGWVQWHGRALVEHVRERLLPQVGRILISANRNVERYGHLGHTVIEDEDEGKGAYLGPLAGMLAGLRHAVLPWVAFVPCDAPALPLDLVAALALASSGRHPVLATCGGQPEPVFCLMPAALAPTLAAALAGGERRPAHFLRQAGAVELAFADAAGFANINLPDPPPAALHDEPS